MATTMKRLGSIALALMLAVAFMPIAGLQQRAAADEAGGALVAQADTTEHLKITGIEYYDEVQAVLEIVNKERREIGIPELVLDEELTAASMQRAAELGLYFEHTRPDGSSCYSASSKMSAENIAAGQRSAAAAMNSWFYEERALYESGITDFSRTGHYQNIIDPNFRSIGIGCFSPNEGMKYWEQAFSRASGSGTVGNAQKANVTHDVLVDYSVCAKISGFNMNMRLDYLQPGETFQMEVCFINEGWKGTYCSIDAVATGVTWTTSDPAVCSVDSSGLVTAKGFGTTTITATLPSSGKKITHDWSVKKSLANAQFAPIPDQMYSGKEIIPSPEVTLDGVKLVEGVDYTKRAVDSPYVNNIDARDNVAVVIEGIGNYVDSAHTYFKILPLTITSAAFSQTKFTYDGTEKKPELVVKCGDKVLENGKDFRAYSGTSTVTAGTKEFNIIGIGNYTGSLPASFVIEKAPISSVELSQTRFTYDGTDKIPEITVKSGNTVLEAGKDYGYVINNGPFGGYSAPGPRTVVVQGFNNYSGRAEAQYDIVVDGSTNPSGPSDPAPVTPNNPNVSTNPNTPVSPGTPDVTDTPNAPSDPSGEGNGGADQSSSDVPSIDSQEMFRLYNPNSGEHFYTASDVERDSLTAIGWEYEGVAWKAPKSGPQVYRLYNAVGGEHHYTPNAGERDNLVAAGWVWEEGGWCTDESETVPLYRLYNPNAFANNHHYTTDLDEFLALQGMGWQDEGIAWHGIR